MRMTQQPDQDDHADTQGDCDRCGQTVYRFRGDATIDCPRCGAIYSCSGQRLRDDLYSRINPSEYDDDIGDLEGDELSWLRQETY